MKVRIKFSKEGPVKFVGHLDTMRYFQKAIRRANLPVAFSGGYSPHMIMSFAAPLGVGTESLGEYFDLELAETVPTSEITRRLDAVMVEGVHILSRYCTVYEKTGFYDPYQYMYLVPVRLKTERQVRQCHWWQQPIIM